MSAARNILELVDRKMDLLEIEEKFTDMSQGQTTADFFSVSDRRELMKQGIQLEQILRDLSDAKAAAKEALKDNTEWLEAHEKRLRALEDDRLELHTQIKTSWWWIVLFSGGVSVAVNFIMKWIVK